MVKIFVKKVTFFQRFGSMVNPKTLDIGIHIVTDFNIL